MKRIRSLSHVTGGITDQEDLRVWAQTSSSAGLGAAVERFLNAWGFDATAKLGISSAYDKHKLDSDEFAADLCRRGMARDEALWLFDFIAFTHTD